VADLSDAYAQALPHPKPQVIQEDLELFQAACAVIPKVGLKRLARQE
jgi:hypothetical protein